MRNAPLPAAMLMAVLSMSLTSCSRNPVAPDSAAPTQTGTTSSMVSEIPTDTPNSDGGVPNDMFLAVSPGEEAWLFAGRFTLHFHKNSLSMPALIRLKVSDPLATQVHIEVSPPEANVFQVQAELIANLSDLPVDYTQETVGDLDGALSGQLAVVTGQWDESTDVASHPNQLNVTAKMVSATDCMVGPRPKTIKKNAAGF